MTGSGDFGRVLMALGAVIFVAGLLFWSGVKMPLGRLPGDISIQRGSWSFQFPIVTCLVVSLVLTLVLSLLRR